MNLDAPFTVVLLGRRSASLTVLERHCSDAGLLVERVIEPADVRRRIESRRCEIVAIDADRNDDCGLVFCRGLKEQPATVDVPIIAVTRVPERRTIAWDYGVDEVLNLLPKHDELVMRIRALVRLGRVRRMHSADQLAAEVARREVIRETFRRYVSPSLADEILARPTVPVSAFEHPNRTARAAVMFVDMRGFTRIAESLEPDSVVRILNEYFTLLTEITFRHEGTVFNMAGDCLMMGFGVPLEQTNIAVRATRTANEILTRFAGLAGTWRGRYGIETGVGIGINIGDVVAGNVGSEHYMSYTIIGDTVNVASRLAQRARAGEMLFSNSIMDALEGTPFATRAVSLPALTLRGRSSALDIHCIPALERIDVRPAVPTLN